MAKDNRHKGKSNQQRKRLRLEKKIRQQAKQNISDPPSIIVKKGIRFFKGGYWVITLIVTIAALIFLPEQCRQFLKSKKERFEEETVLKGILIPEKLLKMNSQINVQLGSSTFGKDISAFEEGFVVSNLGVNLAGTAPFDLKLKIIAGRIYVSTLLRYIEDSEPIVFLDYGRWKFIKRNVIDYTDSDSTLKVVDKKNNIVLDLKYIYPNTIKIKGYCIGQKYITVASDTNLEMFPPSLLDSAKKRISETLQNR